MTKQENIIETIGDGSIAAIAAVVSMNYPDLAFLMGVLTSATVTISQAKFRCLFTEIFSKVERLRQENVNIEYLSSPQFIHEVELLLHEKSLEDLEQKRMLYANYFESCCRCSSTEKLNSQRYFVLLKDLDILEFTMLKLLPPKEVTFFTSTTIYNECIQHFDGLKQGDITMRLDSLMSKGLIKSISSTEVSNLLKRYGSIKLPREHICYYKTELGRNLLQFIGEDSR